MKASISCQKRLNHVCSNFSCQRPIFLFSFKYETTLMIKYLDVHSASIMQVKVWIVSFENNHVFVPLTPLI